MDARVVLVHIQHIPRIACPPIRCDPTPLAIPRRCTKLLRHARCKPVNPMPSLTA
jgi:hypothetical protein